ncbi:LytR/AlgR family response regulator transcription factor [Alishewanella jeotgali]|uniref:Response regulator receiver domain-containing protein n=1 Tax=Alishewanella jeotgali KCTC 22429 TaxID=1129374 RepID=H3ZGB7_9ALTE|nr:LytTR family DNA-binding domain-containing protein [Alishewanella jeotgali]EHR40437.1 response regulator receiver domain-containing protein [Alishewanella jeotgali KCTC 22429]
MTSGNSWFVQCVQRHPVRSGYLLFALFLILNAAVNVSSIWTAEQRQPDSTLLIWQPILWEYSSVLSTLSLSPLLFWWFGRHPLQFKAPARQLLLHLAASVVFSLSHVGIMVTLRSWVYRWLGSDYQFGPLGRELIYEYRKDLWAYLVFLCAFQLARFVHARLQGEAYVVGTAVSADAAGDPSHQGATSGTVEQPGYFLVKKLDKEYLIRVEDIAWLEANGNYVNLHSEGRIYPLRATLAATLETLQQAGFCRIHRSLAVNLRYIESIGYQSSGDGSILLKTGQQLTLSRRYKEQFKATVDWTQTKP